MDGRNNNDNLWNIESVGTMPSSTHFLIQRITIGSATSAVSFSTIPQTYTDLKLIISARGSNSGAYSNTSIQFNGGGGTYADKLIYAVGTGNAVTQNTVFPTAAFIGDIPASGAYANTFSNQEIYITNYKDTNNYKGYYTVSAHEDNIAAAFLEADAGVWQSTAAITSMLITCGNSGQFVTNSVFDLYGISKS
jgi:hypothetical protein